MIQVPLYNAQGDDKGTMELSEDIFGIKSKNSLVHQVYVAMRANLREPWADTKNRGEVRGGGIKPWKQKGTGRARHGSIRSPIWKGGGVAFGPLSIRNYKQKINKKMGKLATQMCFADKVKDKKFLVVEEFDASGKTATTVKFRSKLPGSGRTTLMLVDSINAQVKRATANIQKLEVKRVSDVSVLDLMHHQYLIINQNGLKVLEKRLA